MRKLKRKFSNFRRTYSPITDVLYKNYAVELESGMKVLSTQHREFFADSEFKAAKRIGLFLQTAWFDADWTPRSTDADKDEAPFGSTHTVLCQIDNSGNPIGRKLEAPNPPFTGDGPT